jgi:hypothetical protein
MSVSWLTLILLHVSRVGSWTPQYSHLGCTCFFSGMTWRASQLAATLTLIKPSFFNSLTRLAGAFTIGIFKSTFFNPSHVILRKTPDEGGKAWLMIFTVKPLHMPTLERRFQRKVEEIAVWTSLDTNAANHLPSSSAGLVF